MFKQVSARAVAQRQASLFDGGADEFVLVSQDAKGKDVEPEPMFSVDGQVFGLQSMLGANSDDEDLCQWLKACKVGESFPSMLSCQRVS